VILLNSGIAQTTVTAVVPSNNALNVSPATTIQITFSDAMLTGSFNDMTSFVVRGMTSGRHLGSFGFTFGNTVATFTPTVPFLKGERVVVDISSSLQNMSSIAVTPFVFSFTVSVNSSAGTFATKVDYATGSQPFSIFISDVDSDGDGDLAVANRSSNTVSIRKNNGDGTYGVIVDYATGSNPFSVFINDVDADGDGDLAVANFSSNTVSLFKNNGDGTYTSAVDYATGSNPFSVFISDVDGDGDGDLAVANASSSTISILKNNGDGTYATKVDYATGADPKSIFICDLDGDGDGDIATANASNNTVSILKNNGDGTYATKVDYATGSDPFSVFVSDVDGDGDGDLAVANYSSGTVAVLKNNGDGTYAAKVDYATGSNPISVFISDVDGDGDGDIAAANYGSNTVSILKNNSDGTFAANVDYATGSIPYSVFVSDVDGDGANDLAVANFSSNTVSILKGNSSPTNPAVAGAASPSPVPAGHPTLLTGTVTPGTNPASTGLTVRGDLSSIGGSVIQPFYDDATHGDVISGDNIFSFSATVAPATPVGLKSLPLTVNDGQARMGTGSISLAVIPPPTVTAVVPAKTALNVSPATAIQITFSEAMLTGSFDDMTSFVVRGMTSGRHLGSFGFTAGNTVATFTPVVPFKNGEIVVVDISGNLQSASGFALSPFVYSFTVNASVAPGTFTGRVDYTAGSQFRSVFVHDLDGDGDGDIVAANAISNTVSIIKNNGDGTFAANVDYAAADNVLSVFVGDLDGDGDGDLAVGNGLSASIFKNNGDGTFAARVDYPAVGGALSVFISDLDGDGDGDLALAGYNLAILKNNGDGTFAAVVDYYAGSYCYSFFISDLDGDGDGDAVTASYDANTISVLKNNGDGTFATKVNYYAGNGSIAVFISDLDSDGDGDLAVANAWGNVSILKNNGDGTFAATVDYAGGGYVSVFISDIDGDGDGDLALGAVNGDVSIMKNNGDGTFAARVDYSPTGDYHPSIFVSDLDADGDGDIVTGNYYAGTVTVLKNDYIYDTLIVNIVGNGSVTKLPDQQTYLDGSTVQLDPTPALGYVFSGWSGSASGSDDPLDVVMDGDKDITAIFTIDPGYEVMYRTATYNDWATAVDAKGKYKPVKRKDDKVLLKFNIGAPANSTGFTISFSMFVKGRMTVGKTKEIQLGDSLRNVKTATFAALTIAQGDTFQFDGYGLNGKMATVKVTWETFPRPIKQTITEFKYNDPKLPMPNLHNIGIELFPGGFGQTGPYFSGGLLVGVPQGSTGGNSVLHAKYSDVQKSLVKLIHGVPLFHTDYVRCLDTFPATHKPIKRQLKNLPPDKYNNKLFAELLTLKLNVSASATNKFPVGLGELTFDDQTDPFNPFNGQLIGTIIQKADTMISCLSLTSKPIPPTLGDLYDVLHRLNGAFAGVIDTFSFSAKTRLTGAKQLIDVPYLRKTPGIEPVNIFVGDYVEQRVPAEFALQQNYPNPFNPTTTITFDLAIPSNVSLRIYDMLGQEVAVLLSSQEMEEGNYEFDFNADNLSSGVYLYRLEGRSLADENHEAGSFRIMKKMLLVK